MGSPGCWNNLSEVQAIHAFDFFNNNENDNLYAYNQ
jgi:hypothetical protein